MFVRNVLTKKKTFLSAQMQILLPVNISNGRDIKTRLSNRCKIASTMWCDKQQAHERTPLGFRSNKLTEMHRFVCSLVRGLLAAVRLALSAIILL